VKDQQSNDEEMVKDQELIEEDLDSVAGGVNIPRGPIINPGNIGDIIK
jgi:hypothetical protein